MRPRVVAMHTRSGLTALNVVTAALDTDPRTEGADVVFAKSAADMIRAIEGAEGSVVGAWSFYSPDFGAVSEDLARVRAATSRALHVAGGVHASAEPRATLDAGFDVVVVGEGEHTFVELVAAVAEGRGPHGLPGTAYRDAAGGLVSHGPGKRSPLDAFPAMNFRRRKMNAIEITRGCVYACSFCQTPYMFKARFRHRSVENVREHIDEMARGGSQFVRFLTPTSLSYGSEDTTPDLGAVEALLRSVREGLGSEGKIFFGTFPSEIRPEHVTDEALAILARWVDNDTLVIGGQSGSDRVLEDSRRGHTVEDVIHAVERAVRHGFRPDVDFLLGLPGETREDRELSMRLAERLVGMGARIHSHAFMPLPGTPLRDRAPETLEPEAVRAMERLEAQGWAYGQWRKQLVTAQDLLARRPGRAATS